MTHYYRTLFAFAAAISLLLVLILTTGCRQTCPTVRNEQDTRIVEWQQITGGVAGKVETVRQ